MSTIKYVIGHALLPVTRNELPRWWHTVKALGLWDYVNDHQWSGHKPKLVRGKLHGFLMKLDLANWSQRRTWLLGRFYELDTQMVIKKLVHEGDIFVDVGANIGMITLLASKQVGTTGRVFAFEPHPVAYGSLKEVIEMNHILNVEVVQAALSDTESTATLTVMGDHNGVGTLAKLNPKNASANSSQFEVSTQIGDNALSHLDHQKAVFIKIDVEGYEVNVLRGLVKTIKDYRPVILTEFIAEQLERAGASARELTDLMQEFGYDPYNIVVSRHGLGYQCHLALTTIRGISGSNVVWKPKPNIR